MDEQEAGKKKLIQQHNIPAPLPSFIGRKKEIETIIKKLLTSNRLVTLTGAGEC